MIPPDRPSYCATTTQTIMNKNVGNAQIGRQYRKYVDNVDNIGNGPYAKSKQKPE